MEISGHELKSKAVLVVIVPSPAQPWSAVHVYIQGCKELELAKVGLVAWMKTRGGKEVGFVCPSRKGMMHQESKLGRKEVRLREV